MKMSHEGNEHAFQQKRLDRWGEAFVALASINRLDFGLQMVH